MSSLLLDSKAAFQRGEIWGGPGSSSRGFDAKACCETPISKENTSSEAVEKEKSCSEPGQRTRKELLPIKLSRGWLSLEKHSSMYSSCGRKKLVVKLLEVR